MAIKALLLDRDREVFPLLGDIFNVTGHKLLIATNDDMFQELVESADVDIVILNHTDVKIWLTAFTKEKIPLPFFLLDREEEEVKFKSIGFSELNFTLKPFNPLELLNKLSCLHRFSPEEDTKELGLVNTLIKLSYGGNTTLVEVSNSKSCLLTVQEGKVKGMDCTVEELRTILESEKLSIQLKPFEAINHEQSFEDTKEFLKVLLEKVRPVPAVAKHVHVWEGVKLLEELDKGLYRVSKFSTVPALLKNVYLRIYEGNNKSVAFLINIGSLDEWSGVKNLVEDILFNLDELDGVILLSDEVSSIYNSFMLAEQKANIRFITDHTIKRQLSEAGFKSGRIRTFGDFPSYVANLATGHRLRFIPINFSPSMGGFCLYEEDTGFLFTPHLLSSFYNESSDDITQEVKLYHRIFMPCSLILEQALSKVSHLEVKMVLPRYGLPYSEFKGAIRKLSGIRAGSDFLPVNDKGKMLSIVNRVLEFVLSTEDKEVSGKFVEEVAKCCVVENGVVTETYVEPRFTVELLFNSAVHVPGIRPSTLVGILSILDDEEVFINPF